MPKNQPLAVAMRPHTIDHIVGQKHILHDDSLLYKMIKYDKLYSIILYGPPGTGKTTIARVIAETTNAEFYQINAVSSGKKDIETVCKKAMSLRDTDPDKQCILFIDEIHRFNKAQQDYLLPFVESGAVVLIGATTENPYFEVNPALVSRSVLFQLQPIGEEDIAELIDRAIADDVNGLAAIDSYSITIDARLHIARQAAGDARHAMSILELAAIQSADSVIDLDDVIAVIQKPHLHYDKSGDKHYDTISAFIKSIRGSDPDAALYYLARMLESGEDPKFIARRIMISASEDIGNADPMALVLATNASLAVERIGLPEGNLILSQAVLYLAMAPKSNSATTGISNALQYIKDHPDSEIPRPLRDAHYKSAKKLGHGANYLYPHDYPNHYVPQRYLPDSVNEYFYTNSHVGYEEEQAKYLNTINTFYKNNPPVQENNT